ncbi:MAG TPA: DUF1015 domain-containing protein [Candidatus Brocadiia bacterium]|nr:DUF1015 domain-containing protein [Candidatus Brocadiales bacterium]
MPFRGIRYNLEPIEDFSKVLTPPYDVISPQDREKYYELHPHNIIRLILGKELPDDNEHENKYTRAARFLHNWLREGVFKRDICPSIYVYDQEFELEGRKFVRRGFISGVKLEEFGTGHIYPHEQTMPGPKEDRLKLIRACKANLSPIFALYPDNAIEGVLTDAVQHSSKAITAFDEAGVKNCFWAIDDPAIIAKIQGLMKDKPLFIADGHHRYESALAYRNELKGKHGQESAVDYIMMMCVSLNNPGLKILPTHRVIKNLPASFSLEQFKTAIKDSFNVENLGKDCNVHSLIKKLHQHADKHAFGMYEGKEKRFYLLLLRNEIKSTLNQVQGWRHPEWKDLDVCILHDLILDKYLGIKTDENVKQDSIEYIQSEVEAVKLVNEGKYQLAFFHNPTLIEQVSRIASVRQKMPPKATYFYPKPLTGLVINSFD